MSRWENHLEANKHTFPETDEFQLALYLTLGTYDLFRTSINEDSIDNFELHIYNVEDGYEQAIYYEDGRVQFRDNMFFEEFGY